MSLTAISAAVKAKNAMRKRHSRRAQFDQVLAKKEEGDKEKEEEERVRKFYADNGLQYVRPSVRSNKLSWML